jgi:hypothetical protein
MYSEKQVKNSCPAAFESKCGRKINQLILQLKTFNWVSFSIPLNFEGGGKQKLKLSPVAPTPYPADSL